MKVPIAQKIAKGIQDAGGILTLEDSSTYQTQISYASSRRVRTGLKLFLCHPHLLEVLLLFNSWPTLNERIAMEHLKMALGSHSGHPRILNGLAHAFSDRALILVIRKILFSFR